MLCMLCMYDKSVINIRQTCMYGVVYVCMRVMYVMYGLCVYVRACYVKHVCTVCVSVSTHVCNVSICLRFLRVMCAKCKLCLRVV